MNYYVYGSPVGDPDHSVWRMSGEGFQAQPDKVREGITVDHARDVAKLLADRDETVALDYPLYSWLWHRVKEGQQPTMTYTPASDNDHFVTVWISVLGRDDRQFLATSSTDSKALFDLVEAMVGSPLPKEIPAKAEKPEPPHNGRLITFYRNVWVGNELFECSPVVLAEVPAERFKGTGTIVNIDSPKMKRVALQKGGYTHHVWRETGEVAKVEVVLESPRRVAQPVPGYVYCQFHLR